MDTPPTEMELVPENTDGEPITRPIFDVTQMPFNIPMLQSVLDSFSEHPTVDDVKKFIEKYHIEELKESRDWIVAVLGTCQERTKNRRSSLWKAWLKNIPDGSPDMCLNCHELDTDDAPVETNSDETEVASDDDAATEPPSNDSSRSKKRSSSSKHPLFCSSCTTRNSATFEELMQRLGRCLSPRLHVTELFKKNHNILSTFERCVQYPYMELENNIEARIKALHRVATEFVLDRPVKGSVGMLSMCYLSPSFVKHVVRVL